LRFINTGSGGQTWDILGGTNGASNAGLGFLNGSTTYMQLSTTGLAVTGALSATGIITTATQVTSSGSNPLRLQCPTNTSVTIGVDGGSQFVVAGYAPATFSQGLAVTGALSSTTGATFATSSGDVGIGTASPQRQFVINSSFPVIQFTNPTSGTTSNDGLLIYLNGLNAAISNQEAGALFFETNNTDRMRIDSSGNVGIGTASPGSKLDVNGEIRIGNTVNTVSPTSPNRTVTIVIGGTTYYLAAKTTND
jgi:hypothetical protein